MNRFKRPALTILLMMSVLWTVTVFSGCKREETEQPGNETDGSGADVTEAQVEEIEPADRYVLFYNSGVYDFKDTHDMDTLLEKAENVEKKLVMEANSGLYLTAFFSPAGFGVEKNSNGSTSLEWNGTSESGYTGVDVVQSLLRMSEGAYFEAIEEDQITGDFVKENCCAVIAKESGESLFKEAWGSDCKMTELPGFTCAGEQLLIADYLENDQVGADFYAPAKKLGEDISKQCVSADDRLAIQAFMDEFVKQFGKGK